MTIKEIVTQGKKEYVATSCATCFRRGVPSFRFRLPSASDGDIENVRYRAMRHDRTGKHDVTIIIQTKVRDIQEQPMRKELTLGIILGVVALSELAFSRPQRHAMGSVRGWECERKGCGKRYADGWMLEFNHVIPLEEGGTDTEDNAELLCLYHHLNFHKKRGDFRAWRSIEARINKSKGGRTWSWIKENT